MRILFASPDKGIGGISLWTDNIMSYYRSLDVAEVTIDMLSMGRKSLFNLKSFARRAWKGIVIYSKVIREERRLLRDNQYDVFHLCTSASMSLIKDLMMLGMAKRHHVHTVLHFHFGRIPELKEKNNWEWKLLRRVVGMADVAVTIDRKSFEALSSTFGKKVYYLPNPLAHTVSDYVLAHEQEKQRDERMLLYAGHCVRTKGVFELVRVCKEMKDIRLVLAGRIQDDVRQQLEEIAGDGQWLEILGVVPREEVLRMMMHCGIFVLPSYTEGFPNVILESMACGCSIVSTNVGEIPRMIGDENGQKAGLLVPPKTHGPLKEALCRMLEDKALRDECRKNARERVFERYNMELIWQQMTAMWRYSVES